MSLDITWLRDDSTSAIQTSNLWAAEAAMREMVPVSLLDALDYLGLLAAQRPDRFDRAAVRWHGRLEAEAAALTLAEAQLALAALVLARVPPVLN